MSLKPSFLTEIPEQTTLVARAAFPRGCRYMTMHDEFGTIFEDQQFEDLFAKRGQPALAPWRLALITLMQFMEDLTDRQAADAVRSRIDWKYALGLELTDPGFHYSVLSEFRDRLIDHKASRRLFDTLLALLQEKGWLKAGGKQRTDSTHIIGNIRRLNRLGIVGETMYAALNTLAVAVPEWLKARVPTSWFKFYGSSFEEYRLPDDKEKRDELAVKIGLDGMMVLRWIFEPTAPGWLRELPAIKTLHQIWLQHYYLQAGGLVYRKAEESVPPSVMIASPYDLDTRYSTKRSETWVGYKVHLTETCDLKSPHFITEVLTTLATTQDTEVVDTIHQQLQAKTLLPSEHLVDAAYISARLLIDSLTLYNVQLLGPMRPTTSWQSRDENAFDISHFQIDWENKVATCPNGKQSHRWKTVKTGRQKTIVQAMFPPQDCQICPLRARCTTNQLNGRSILLHSGQQEHEMLQKAREYEKTEEFKERYHRRAGIEGTISEAVFALNMRRTRFRGLDKVHLQHLLTAAAINLKRAVSWIWGVPHTLTRTSHFARLGAA
jgi:transposase